MTPLTVGSLFSPSGGDIIEKLTVLDLFSGIGGFSLGLQRTGGFETIAFCEIDPFCRKVLAKHWPDVPCFEDITKLDKEELDKLGRIDVICGGFPCQDISCAGKGAGIHAERSGLWWEMLRIIRLVRPRFVLVENVAALLNRGLDEVLGSLAESGYDAEWQILSAKFVGSQQRRERLYLVAYPTLPGIISQSARDERTRWGISVGGGLFGGDREVAGGQTSKAQRYTEPWATEPSICRVVDGIPNQLDRLRALGNAIVPQCAQFVGQCILDSIRTEATQ
jgi:DNA (cytosine-5)-methyltransferase 1